jgi:hypothetical protein
VEKMLHCRDPAHGYRSYRCPECGETMKIPFACKSRIYTRRGKKHGDEWADKLAETLYNISHRHMVFTIPEKLRAVLEADGQG